MEQPAWLFLRFVLWCWAALFVAVAVLWLVVPLERHKRRGPRQRWRRRY